MPQLDFRRILCPVNLSSSAQAGRQDDQASGATLYLLHVIDNPFDELYMSSIAQADPALLGLYKSEPLKRARIVRATEYHSEVLLKQFFNEWVGMLPKVRYRIESGDPFEAILDTAESTRADLIVLAMHGRPVSKDSSSETSPRRSCATPPVPC